MQEGIQQEKERLRKEILSRRSQLSADFRAAASKRIVEQIAASPYYRKAKVILAFAPFRKEVQIDALLEHCWQDGKHVYLPKVNANERVMQFYRVFDWLDLEQGHYGIREPRESCSVLSGEAIDLILIPGAAFDQKKGRLGYGAGYYDRFLRQLVTKPIILAPAFAMQIVAHVPTDPWDYPIDLILTEEGWVE